MSDTPRTGVLKVKHEQAWANTKLGLKDLPEALDPWNIARDMERLYNSEKANFAELEADLAAYKSMCAELAEEPVRGGDMKAFLYKRRAALARYEAMKKGGV